MKIGILTGGGDCPGLNAALRGFVVAATPLGIETWGIRYGWRGLVEGLIDPAPLKIDALDEAHSKGGTILKTSRTNPYGSPSDRGAMLSVIADSRFDAIVAIGGDDTLGVAAKLNADGVPTVGVPKTLDNDLAGTEMTFGFDSAVQTATEAIDRILDTARSHERILVVEVMGRHAGWVALFSAVSGCADWVMLPEIPVNFEAVCARIMELRSQGKRYAIVVVSEGIELPEAITGGTHERDAFGHRRLNNLNVAQAVAEEIERRTGLTTRSTSVGYAQRGGSPTAYDRILAARFGRRAAEAVSRREFGTMVALRCGELVTVPLEQRKTRTVPESLLHELKSLVGM